MQGVEGNRHLQSVETIDLGACEDYAVMGASTLTCAAAPNCNIRGGFLGLEPGTSVTGNWVYDLPEEEVNDVYCARDGMKAFTLARKRTGTPLASVQIGGKTFLPGVYTHAAAINIALANPKVYLDAGGDPDAVFIFNIGTTLTTCALSEIVLLNNASEDNVFWVLGTALTMGANSVMVGNVLAGSAITIGAKGKILGRGIAFTAVTCASECTIETTGRPSTCWGDRLDYLDPLRNCL